jgi:hypothetical protein
MVLTAGQRGDSRNSPPSWRRSAWPESVAAGPARVPAWSSPTRRTRPRPTGRTCAGGHQSVHPQQSRPGRQPAQEGLERRTATGLRLDRLPAETRRRMQYHRLKRHRGMATATTSRPLPRNRDHHRHQRMALTTYETRSRGLPGTSWRTNARPLPVVGPSPSRRRR